MPGALVRSVLGGNSARGRFNKAQPESGGARSQEIRRVVIRPCHHSVKPLPSAKSAKGACFHYARAQLGDGWLLDLPEAAQAEFRVANTMTSSR